MVIPGVNGSILASAYQQSKLRRRFNQGGPVKPYANLWAVSPQGDFNYQAGLNKGPISARVTGSTNVPNLRQNFLEPSLSMNAGPANVVFTPRGVSAGIEGGNAYLQGSTDYSGETASVQGGVFGQKFGVNADAFLDRSKYVDTGVTASYNVAPGLAVEGSYRYNNFEGPSQNYFLGARYNKRFKGGGSTEDSSELTLPTDPVSLNNTRKFYVQWHASPRYNEMLRKSTNTIEPVEITKKLTSADKVGRFIRKVANTGSQFYLGTDWPDIKKSLFENKRKDFYNENNVSFNPGLSYTSISEGRKRNLNLTPNTILPLPQEDIDSGVAGHSVSYRSGQIETNPLYYLNPAPEDVNFYHNELLPHELSHSTDRPLANSNERLIPQADIDQIKSRINPDANPHIPGFWSRYGQTPEEGAVNYFSNPTEVRARLNEIRYNLNKEGVDIFNKPVTQEDLDQLNTRSAVGDLQGIYRNEDLLWLINNISKKDLSKESNYAKRGGRLQQAYKSRK